MVEVLLIAAVGLSLVTITLLIIRTSSGSRDRAIEDAIRGEFRLARQESDKNALDLRTEVRDALKSSTDSLVNNLGQFRTSQEDRVDTVVGQVRDLTDSTAKQQGEFRDTVEVQIKNLQESNERKLDEIRKTVDDKLQDTLEKRLGASFDLVSTRLEAVQQGLGEMRNLATGVGDLKKVLTNVKARGTWGEVQLGAILEDILTPDQFEKNVRIKENSQEAVDYVVVLPGPKDGSESRVLLPIDSKFPQEDYLRLQEAADKGDAEGVKTEAASLVRSIRTSARDISSKYINPPATTDFAIMFLATEGLYAEVLRQAGLVQELQHNNRILVAGPTTLAATLSSLRMGFRTLAIEQRASEAWKVLSAVRTEFRKFGEILDRAKKQLNTVTRTIEDTETRTRVIEKRLRGVEELPDHAAGESVQLPTTIEYETEEEDSDSARNGMTP